jgi:hypothetical protein
MRNVIQKRKPRGLLLSLLLLALFLVALFLLGVMCFSYGCPRWMVTGCSVKGCVIGSKTDGVFVLSLSDGRLTKLLASDEEHNYNQPVFDLKSQTLYCIDDSNHVVVSLTKGQSQPRELFRIPEGYALRWPGLRLSAEGEKLYISLAFPYSSRNPELSEKHKDYSVICDAASGEVLAEIPILPAEGVWLDDTHLLTVKNISENSPSAEQTRRLAVGNYEIMEGTFQEEMVLEDGYEPVGPLWMSPAGDRVLVSTDEGYKLYTVTNGKLMKKFANNRLPGHSAGDCCFVGSNHFLIHRQYDILNPIFPPVHLLLVNLGTLWFCEITEEGYDPLGDLQYLPEYPEW